MRNFMILLILSSVFCWGQASTFNPYDTLDRPTDVVAEENDVLFIGTYGGSNFLYGLSNNVSFGFDLLGGYFNAAELLALADNVFNFLVNDGTITGGSFTGTNGTIATSSVNISSGADLLSSANNFYTSSELNSTAFVIDSVTGQVLDSTSISYSTHGNLANTGSTVTVNGKTYNVAGAANYSPIIIDLNGNSKPDTNRNEWKPHAPKFYNDKTKGDRTSIFDITGDGRPNFIEWLGPEDGLLVMPEADGSIKNGNNLFGTAGGYRDGYLKMKLVLDANRNGWVEGDELAGLYIWQDKNSNAKLDKGEMQPIAKFNIEKISVNHKKFESVCYIKGKEVKTWDWWPAGFDLIKRAK